ncbi:uncharacterized protein LOC122945781 [Bufo gargarizans]|uniref:uncharacterized protein LOC122945781 n=1 Tax=Bufo gargarizans TaxID=30331 RepID=UPI001CF5305E|nr:uncharacterized protein LOC122945781 [Bufo gargarizans]
MISLEQRWRRINEGAAMGRARALLLLFLCHTCSGLEIAVPPSKVGIVHTDVLLPCTFKVEKYPINPQFLAVFWHFGEKEIARYDSKTKESTSRFTIDGQSVKQGNASLTIHNVAVSDKGTYKCTVIYTPSNQEKNIELNILAIPVVKIHKKAILRGGISLLQCSITNLFPKDMKVIWLKNGQTISELVTQDDETNPDETLTRNSSVNVTFLEEQGNPKITCQVEHEYLQDPIKDFYIVQYGAAPIVSITASRTPDGNDQIYMCEATNYSPEEVTMHWLLDGKRINSYRQSNSGYFSKEIYHWIPLQGDKRPSQISCEVEHETLNSPIKMTEEVKVEHDCKRSCHFGLIGVLAGLLVTALPGLWYFMKRDSQRFQVSHIHRVETADNKVTIYCMASNCPEDVQVTWRITENDGGKIIISDIKQENDEEAALVTGSDYYNVETDRSYEDKLHNVVSSLSFTPVVSKHKEMAFSCTFQCNGRSQEKSQRFSFIFKRPESSDPVQMSLGDNGDVLCSVSLQNFFPKDIRIQWSHGLGHFQNVETSDEKFTKNKDFTFNVRSECRIPGHVLKDQGYRVRAIWSHKAESKEKEASITDFAWRPVMGEIEKPTFTDGKEAKLLCRVSGYFPDALDVKWLRRDADNQEFYVVSASDKYKIPVMEATLQEDKTFTYTACLILSVSAATDHGSEFICRVRHPSVTGPLEKTTGEISVIGIRAVNVTLLNKEKIRAEVVHFTPNDIKITWSKRKEKDKNYKVSKKIEKKVKRENRAGSCVSEITIKSKKDKKYYKVVVEDNASNAVVEMIVLRENGEYYLTDNENRKTPLAEIPEQQGTNVNEENEEPAAETQRTEEETSHSKEKKEQRQKFPKNVFKH